MIEQCGYIVLSKDETKILTFNSKYFVSIDNLGESNIRVFKDVSRIKSFFKHTKFPEDIINEIIIKKVKLEFYECED